MADESHDVLVGSKDFIPTVDALVTAQKEAMQSVKWKQKHKHKNKRNQKQTNINKQKKTKTASTWTNKTNKHIS